MVERQLAVLDDDPAMRKTIGMMAQRLGWEVRLCATLAELEAVVSSIMPDVVLIDLMMPDLDGIDVVRMIGPRFAGSLYVMSGTDQRTLDASCEVLAACGTKIAGCLHKPFGVADLAGILTEAPARCLPAQVQSSEPARPEILSSDEFEAAVLSGRIEPHFQPIYLSDGVTLKGFEALARIEGGKTPGFPRAYLDQLAADDSLGVALTDLVIQRSLQFMAGLPAGHEGLTISINLFGNYAVAEGLREWLVRQCSLNGIDRTRVILELSEATVFDFSDDDVRRITQLRLAGFGLSIDDFGTGHSSLGRLASLPFSELKIDKAFCLASLQSRPAAAIIEACLGLAARLDMKVTAEGVESEELAAVLASMGCDALQGHLFGRAMPACEAFEWLRTTATRAAAVANPPRVPIARSS